MNTLRAERFSMASRDHAETNRRLNELETHSAQLQREIIDLEKQLRNLQVTVRMLTEGRRVDE